MFCFSLSDEGTVRALISSSLVSSVQLLAILPAPSIFSEGEEVEEVPVLSVGCVGAVDVVVVR